jgi:heme oxygenase
MDRVPQSSPIEALRTATKPLHEQLDALPYARAVVGGTLPIALYGSFLRALHTVHEALETVLERTPQPELRPLFARCAGRRALLAQDLTFLQVDLRAVDAAQLRALVLAQRMRLDARRDPRRLLGHGYVLEGSQLGGQLQAHALASVPALAAGGRAYLVGAGKATRANFEDFLAVLSPQLSSPSALEQATLGAVAAFEGFATILEALDPERQPDKVDRWLVTELNQDAGTHPVPRDVREVQAALSAGEQTYMQFAYYEARYGERGLRFTRSDSAWLATLARDDDAPTTVRHVLWLARTLCSRGMPRLLLEQHLEVLQSALSASVPECASSYQALGLAASELRSEREAAMPGEREAALHASFVTGLRGVAESGIGAREAAALLTAAVADEKRGLGVAVAALTTWLCDPTRFSKTWIAACQHTVTAARQSV